MVIAALIAKLRHDSKGATAIEYGLIAGLIAIAAVASISGLGNVNRKMFANVEATYRTSTGQ